VTFDKGFFLVLSFFVLYVTVPYSRGELDFNLEKNTIKLKLCIRVYICFMDHQKKSPIDLTMETMLFGAFSFLAPNTSIPLKKMKIKDPFRGK